MKNKKWILGVGLFSFAAGVLLRYSGNESTGVFIASILLMGISISFNTFYLVSYKKK